MKNQTSYAGIGILVLGSAILSVHLLYNNPKDFEIWWLVTLGIGILLTVLGLFSVYAGETLND
jgi:hypothetical protein